MINIEIRKPNIDNVNELSQFFEIVIKDTFAKEGLAHKVNDIKNEIEVKKSYLNKCIESNGTKRYFLIALHNKRTVGTIEYGPTSELINDCTNGEIKDVVEIGTVFVHPDYHKKGIGTLMLNMMYLTLSNKNIEEFCLDSGYTKAQKIWKKKFGIPNYQLKDYWGKGYDHMIWRRRVSDLPIVFRMEE